MFDYFPQLRNWASDFNEKHPEVSVEMLKTPNTEDVYKQFLMKFRIKRSDMDLLIGPHSGNILPFVQGGYFEDWSKYLPAEIKADYPEGFLKACSYNGKLYLLPFYDEITGIAYRKDLAQAAGIKDAPRNWDELFQYAKKLNNPQKGIWGMSWDTESAWYFMNTAYVPRMISLVGADKVYDKNWVIDTSSKAAHEAFATFKTWNDSGTYLTIPNVAKWEETEAFKAGKVAILGHWLSHGAWAEESWGKKNIGYWPIPADKYQGSCIAIGGAAIISLSSDEVKKWAAKFYIEQVIPNLDKALMAAGWTPLRKSVYQKPDSPSWMRDILDQSLQNVVYLPPSAIFYDMQETTALAIQKVLLGQATIEAALKEATATINKAYQAAAGK